MPENFSNVGLVKHAKTLLEKPTSYMWGTLTRKIDSNTIQWCLKTYPTQYTHDRVRFLKTQIGKRYGCDCVGLIKSYLFGGIGSPNYCAELDYSTNTIYRAATHKGTINCLPEVAGTCLYMKGHVGIYIGKGKVIECTLGQYGDGVVTTNIDGRGWTHWFNCPHVKYPNDLPVDNNETASELCKGDKVRIKPNAKTYTGSSLATYAYNTVYDVIEIKGNRIVIGINTAVTAAMHSDSLIKQ